MKDPSERMIVFCWVMMQRVQGVKSRKERGQAQDRRPAAAVGGWGVRHARVEEAERVNALLTMHLAKGQSTTEDEIKVPAAVRPVHPRRQRQRGGALHHRAGGQRGCAGAGRYAAWAARPCGRCCWNLINIRGAPGAECGGHAQLRQGARPATRDHHRRGHREGSQASASVGQRHGPGGINGATWQLWLVRMGKESAALREAVWLGVAQLASAMANHIVPWEHIRALMASRLIALDKCLGVLVKCLRRKFQPGGWCRGITFDSHSKGRGSNSPFVHFDDFTESEEDRAAAAAGILR